MKQPRFTEKDIEEMYQILIEIHDGLRDKCINEGGMLKLSPYEIGWLVGIDDFFKKIGKPDNDNECVEFITKYLKAQ